MHLNKIQEDFDKKGLTVLSATGQDRDAVDGFVDELGPEYPILVRAQSAAYSTGGVPNAYLISANGTILWHGHPGTLQDDDIEAGLKDVAKEDRVSTWSFTLAKQIPTVPDKLSGAMKDLEKKKFGKALKEVESKLEKLEGADKEAGQTMRDWIAKNASTEMERADKLVEEKQIYKAYLLYGDLEERFKGHEVSKQAKAKAKDLKKGKETGLEIKASEKLEKVKAEIRGERDAEHKLKALKPMLSKKYAETMAGKQAAELAKELESKAEAKK